MTTARILAIVPNVGAYIPTVWSLEPGQKLGLALSGGGFRASLFHIGVLARLAELDLLRRVDVLSTVSGGSIIGAFYYLKLKKLLEERPLDSNGKPILPTSQDYVDIVAEVENEFLAAVQTNVRMKALLDPVANARMIFSDDYSRSDRIAEVYEQCFYSRFSKKSGEKIPLSALLITPAWMKPGFNVREYNATSDFKIPILNINATSLNTGGRWVFTATDLGEVPSANPIGTIKPLPRISYTDPTLTPEQQKKLAQIGLSEAVAASACVPAIFTPLAIHDLYPRGANGEEIVVELVDGGVYDNQGVEALLSENCDLIICSDASGQLDGNRTPDIQLLPVATRSNDILATRVRAECYDNLRNCPGDGSFVFFHLRDDFPGNSTYPSLPGPVDQCNGVNDGHIYALSNVRTDLDAFSDVEAYTLMYDGYCLADYFLQHNAGNAGLGAPSPGGAPLRPWRFLGIRGMIETDKQKLLSHLLIGKYLFFKPFYADPARTWGVTLLLLAPVLFFLWERFDLVVELYKLFVENILFYILPAALIGAAGYAIVKALDDAPKMLKVFDLIRKYRRADNPVLTALFYAPGLIGAAVAFLNLSIYNKIFLQAGQLPPPSDREAAPEPDRRPEQLEAAAQE